MSLEAQQAIIRNKDKLAGMRWYFPRASLDQTDYLLLEEKRIEAKIIELKKLIKE